MPMKTMNGVKFFSSPIHMPPFEYVPGVLWASEGILGEIIQFFAAMDQPLEVLDPNADGFFPVTFDPGTEQENRVLDVLSTATFLNNQVWPEYVARIFGHPSYFPALPARATEAPKEFPASTRTEVGLIGMLDLGFSSRVNWPGGRPGEGNPPSPGDLPAQDLPAEPGPDGFLSPAIYHGEAVAWVAHTYAPEAEIRAVTLVELLRLDTDEIEAVLNSRELPKYTMSAMVEGLVEVAREEPDVILITSGIRVHPGAIGLQLMGLPQKIKKLAKNAYIVAAAGNDGPNGEPTYPAVHEDVLGVGAVDRDKAGCSGACYSTTVGADVWALGTREVGFITDDFNVQNVVTPGCSPDAQPVRQEFKGGARVAGTSFAAPAVAGAIASEGRFHPDFSAVDRFTAALDRRPELHDGTLDCMRLT